MIWSENPAPAEEFAIPRFLSVIVERRWLILGCAVLGVTGGVLGYLDQPSRYSAEAVLALDARKLQALPTESVVSSLPQESPVLRTEVDIISSRSMAERVLARLQTSGVDVAKGFGLTPNSEANSQADQTTATTSRNARAHIQQRDLLDELTSKVQVTNDGRSYTIYVSFTGMDPDFAAAVANAYAEAYISYQVDLQTTATRRVSDWLGTRLVSMRNELERSEHAATSFREKSGIVKSNGTTLLSQQIAGLNAELARLRAQRAGAAARLATALDLLKKNNGMALAEVLSSPTIQQLRTEEATLNRTLSGISKSGAVKNPQIPQLTSQLQMLQSQIDDEVGKIIDSLRNETEVNRRQQAGLEASLLQLQSDMSAANEAIVQADQLDREASANRTIYESYLTRYKQTIEQDGIAMAEARIISRAVPSEAPSSPSLPTWLLAGLAFGLAAATVASLLLETRARFLRRPDPLESTAGIPVIGRIPELSLAQRSHVSDLIGHTLSPFAQAVADVQSRLRLSARPGNVLVIAVTSAVAGEGKTFIASCLARSLAATGLRTALLDANLTTPGVAAEFGVQPLRTIDAVATQDSVSLDELVRREASSGVDLVCAGAIDVPAEHILGHDGFARLISGMKQNHDVVIIDATALSNGSSALLVSSVADTTVLVVPESGDPLRTVRAIRQLRAAAGTSIGGLVVNCASRSTLSRRNVVSFVVDHLRSAPEARKRVETPVEASSIVGM